MSKCKIKSNQKNYYRNKYQLYLTFTKTRILDYKVSVQNLIIRKTKQNSGKLTYIILFKVFLSKVYKFVLTPYVFEPEIISC